MSGIGRLMAEPVDQGGDSRAVEELPENNPDLAADRPNPFLRALWLAAAVLALGGPGLYTWASSSSIAYRYLSDGIALQVIIQQLVGVLCPAMVTVGLATFSGLLFWHAARWKPSGR